MKRLVFCGLFSVLGIMVVIFVNLPRVKSQTSSNVHLEEWRAKADSLQQVFEYNYALVDAFDEASKNCKNESIKDILEQKRDSFTIENFGVYYSKENYKEAIYFAEKYN
jgi:hypothetical protein